MNGGVRQRRGDASPAVREDLADENARLRAELAQRDRQLAMLFAFSRRASGAAEVETLLDRVLGEAIDALLVDVAMIHFVEPNGRLVLAGLRTRGGDMPSRALELLRDIPLDATTISGRAAHARKSVVADRASWPGATAPIVEPLRACYGASTPLASGERVIGTLCVVRRDDRAFLDEEIQLLEACAAHVSAALEHARLLDQERRRADDLSLMHEVGSLVAQHLDLSTVLSIAVRSSARFVEVPHVFLQLLDEDAVRLTIVATAQDDPSAVGHVLPRTRASLAWRSVLDRAPVVAHDLDDPSLDCTLAQRFGHEAVLAVPLLARGEPIGAMVFGDTRAGRLFGEGEIARAVAVCNQVATAIVNARLYESERRRVEELRLLLDVGRVITASLDLEEILEASSIALSRMVDASHAFVWLLDPKTKILTGVTTSAAEHRKHFRRVRLTLDDPSLAARAVVVRAPVQAVDALRAGEVNQLLNARYQMKSLLALPLMLRDEPIGSIVIGDTRRARAWLPSEVERATVVARQLAVAIANARLFEDLKRSYDELAKTQRVLVDRERLAALGELAAVVAHEVRNPLGIIWNSLVSLRKLLRPTGDVEMLLGIVGEESDRLNRIVGDLLDFARPNEPALRAESLEAILAGAMESAKSAGLPAGIVLDLETGEPLPSVLVDARLLRQAFINLVINAVQAMPKGGRVTIRAALERTGDEARARVDVVDEGPGIPESVAEQVFQPFFTTKATGTGLGLAVVKRIVDAHRGEVRVLPSSDRGTTFRVRLPLA
jgi:signal transduction histidine kinase